MSFQTGLSGLNAASRNLDVIGNNIANANTVGMKESRAEFADIVAGSIGPGGGAQSQGIGVAVATVSQQFTQGTVTITGNSLDVAINGSGFFQVAKTDGTTASTRDGQFKLDKNGNILTNTGANLVGYPTDKTGAATSITPQKLSVPTTAPIAASATTAIEAQFNLDSRAPIASTQTPVTPRSTYGTSINTYDTQGNALPVSLYFTKVNPATAGGSVPATGVDCWAVYSDLNAASTPIAYMAYNGSGALSNVYDGAGVVTGTFGKLPITVVNPNTTPGNITPTVDLSKSTQFGTNFSVSNLTQDGYTSGDFTGLQIDEKGVITTRYSNGQTLKTGGMISLVNFRNMQCLQPVGSGEYLETYKSGAPVLGQPTVGNFGQLRSGAVEESNVDLTAQLVNMMTAQRDYQANAQTIKTQDQVMSTLVNLR